MSKKNEPTMLQVQCPNPKCAQLRPAADQYCGACGSALQANVQQLVKWALTEQTKDREVFQIETATAIAEKVWTWSRLFVSIAGAATLLFILALAVVGYKSITDIDRSRTDAQAAITKAQTDADKSAKDAKDSIKEMKADLQGRLTDIEAKRKEVILQFEKEKVDLEEVSKKVPALVKRIDSVTSRLDKAEPELARLDTKVGELEDHFVGKPVAPSLSDRLNRKLDPFRNYLKALGLREVRSVSFYQGGPNSKTNIAYLGLEQKLIIGAPFLADEQFLENPDAVARESAHIALFGSLADEKMRNMNDTTEELLGLESGLADYYVASWTNDPALYRTAATVMKKLGAFDKDVIRNLKNDLMFKDLKGLDYVNAASVWGGVFWDLRAQLGKSVADKLVTDMWKSIRPEDVKEDPLATAKSLRDRLVELATPIDGGKYVETIRKAFARRGLPI